MHSNSKIQATLSILSKDLSDAIYDKIHQDGEFTNVSDSSPISILKEALTLISLDGYEIDDEGYPYITHIGVVRKSQRVATGLVRVKVCNIIELPKIPFKQLVQMLPAPIQHHAKGLFDVGYTKVPQKTGEQLLKALLEYCPKKRIAIKELISNLNKKKKSIPSTSRAEDAAVEKDALGMALDIFGVDRQNILDMWQTNGQGLGKSFLTGLTEYKSYEDDIIGNDLHNIPGWKVVSESITGIVDFQNESQDTLTVINANRKPIEKATGIDLIYFHREFEAFTFIQYKMMEKQASSTKGDDYYYNPNEKSHNEELARMQSLFDLIKKQPISNTLDNHRVANVPIFFKLCKKLSLKQSDCSIAAGAYIDLDHWKKLLIDPSTLGEKGGRRINYSTLSRRYLGTKTFIDLVQNGFIGTQGESSKVIGLFVEEAIEKGHSVMYAIEQRKK